MSDRELLTECLDVLTHDATQRTFSGGVRMSQLASKLRAALAAPDQTHPGYVLGSHWLETAYSRICAGEAEAEVLRDYGLVRVTDAELEALRKDAERYRWLLNWLAKTGLLYSEYCRIDTPASVGDWWILHKPKVIDGSSVIGHGETANAAIDAAMKGDKT